MADPSDTRQQLRERRLANALAIEGIRSERLALVSHREKRRRQLTEAVSLDWIAPYSDMLDRFRNTGDPVFAGATNYWNRRYGKNWPVFQTEQELAILRSPARLMLATNDYAIGLVNGISAYVIGVGYTYRPAKKRKESTMPPEVIEALQGIVDEILEANEWTGGELPGIEDECFWRSLEDGEFGIVEYPQPDGSTEFRIFEPEQLTQPPGSNYYDWLFGVCTDPEDVQKPLAYWLQWGDSPGDGEEYAPDRITHFKRNGRRGQKRGLTDFCFGHYNRMNLADNLLLNLGDTATQQASIPYVMEHETATQPEVQAMRDDMADFIETETPSGANVAVRKSRRGMGQDIPKGQRYVDGPGIPYADKHLAILDACLRGAVARWNGFEWLISANAGNNNLPVDLSAESPFVRRVLKEQKRYTGTFKKPVWRAVKHRVKTQGLNVLGREYSWEEIESEVDLLVKAPSPQTRNRLEEAQIASIEIPMGVDSRQSYMQTQGRDPDQIEADNQAWQDEHGNDGGGDPLEIPGEGGPKMLDSLGRKIHRQPGGDATESLLESEDAKGHEHKGKGPGGGQFTGSGGGSNSGKGEPAGTGGGASKPPKKKAKKSNAEVEYASSKPSRQSDIDDVLKATLGTDDATEVASVVGAPDSAKVTVDWQWNGDYTKKFSKVTIDHPDFTAVRTIRKTIDGTKTYIQNEEFWIKEGSQGKGLGADIFTMQVENAAELGVSFIRCHAAQENPAEPDKPHNGYYTWPRFGYDQSLTDETGIAKSDVPTFDAARKTFPEAKTVLDIMQTKEGRDWWQKNGTDLLNARFDLTPGSRSMRTLEAYREEKAASKKSN